MKNKDWGFLIFCFQCVITSFILIGIFRELEGLIRLSFGILSLIVMVIMIESIDKLYRRLYNQEESGENGTTN